MGTVIGISPSHDGTLSVLKDGQHVFSIAEERLSRIKGQIGFPFLALDYVVKHGIVDPADVSTIALSVDLFSAGNNWILDFEFTRDKIYYDLQNAKAPAGFKIKNPPFGFMRSAAAARRRMIEVVKNIALKAGLEANVELVDHHSCHAAAAYYASTCYDPLIVTLDGEGDGLSGSVSVEKDGGIHRIAALKQQDSLGNIYSEVTRQLGFKISRHEGKITGLAAYGTSEIGKEMLGSCLEMRDGLPGYRRGAGDLAKSVIGKLAPKGQPTPFAVDARSIAARISGLDPKDQAASVQDFLEDAVCDFIRYWQVKTGKTNLVLNGGVFANVKLNQRIGDLLNVTSVFVYPNMGDGGNAVGAAYLAALRQDAKSVVRSRQTDVYLGPAFSPAQILSVLEGRKSDLEFSKPDDLIPMVAKEIHEGQIIGWFQGRMEYGPRALGNRSILARPTERKLNDELNKRLSRTEFMPFAPSCLIENGDEVFQIGYDALKYPAEFMTITFDVKKDWIDRIQAVSHVDDTARPQFVRAETNPRYHALISEYYRLSGIPMVVNTSFNNHEEPIVCKPEEAIAALDAGVIDLLVLGDYLVRPKPRT